jgi:hypothetical protein
MRARKRGIPKKSDAEMPHEWALRVTRGLQDQVSALAMEMLGTGTFSAQDYALVVAAETAVKYLRLHLITRVTDAEHGPAQG